MSTMNRFIIKGVHPESESEWIEEESFDTAEDAFDHITNLDVIDHGLGHYEVWDTLEGKKVGFLGPNIEALI